ncbi:hypothetical protein FCV25MIE_24317 [Fagus crenata]
MNQKLKSGKQTSNLEGGGTSAVKISSNSDPIETSNLGVDRRSAAKRKGWKEWMEAGGPTGSGDTKRGWERRHVQGRGTGSSEERGDG